MDELAALLHSMVKYHISSQLPIWVFLRFSTEEQQAIDLHALLITISPQPVTPMVIESLVGKELYDKITSKWQDGYEYTKQGYQVSAITLDDYTVPLDDIV